MYRSEACTTCDRWEPVMSYLTDEIASQPECWSKAIETAGSAESALPRPGERVVAQRRALLRGPARGRGPGRDRRLPGVGGARHPPVRPPGIHLQDRHHHR